MFFVFCFLLGVIRNFARMYTRTHVHCLVREGLRVWEGKGKGREKLHVGAWGLYWNVEWGIVGSGQRARGKCGRDRK